MISPYCVAIFERTEWSKLLRQAHGSGNGLLAILLNDICPDDLERAMPIFETPCVEQLIKFKWEGYAQRAFLMQFALHICQTAAYNYLSVRMGRTSTPLLLELKPPVKAVCWLHSNVLDLNAYAVAGISDITYVCARVVAGCRCNLYGGRDMDSNVDAGIPEAVRLFGPAVKIEKMLGIWPVQLRSSTG
eukprot:COSAG01_NODE_2579_length_7430_cov_18.300505_4_plen_189_part_00